MAGMLRVLFALPLLGGAALVLRSLWEPWATDGPRAGRAVPVDGWGWMWAGDVLLAGLCVWAAIVAGVVVFARRGRVTPAALSVVFGALLAIAGTALVREWTGWAIVMDPSDL